MNHLESSFTGKNNVWRYIIMFAAVLIASNTLGAIPLLIAYIGKAASDPSVVSKIADNPNDLGVLGLNPNLGFFMMLFPFLIGLAAFILLIKPLNSRTLGVTVNGTKTFRWNRFIISGSVWIILSVLYLLIYIKVDPTNFKLLDTSGTLVVLIIISLIFIPFQAAFEEVLFRGYLMQGFAVLARNRWIPLVMTSVLFGLMHAFNPEVEAFGFFTMMPQYILLGLIFGIITILDDGIEASTGAHAANNIFLCIMVTNKSSALQTPAVYEQINIYPWIELAALVLTGIVFVIVLKVIFKWGSFSLLLSGVEPKPSSDQSPYTDVLSSVR
jgi:membrane protease YdiL (CAAX protease family)